MQRHLNAIALSALLAIASPAAFAAADTVGPQDAAAVVGLIKYLYDGYANGANDRKSFFETVPWDIETGRLIDRVGQCERKEGAVIDFDWPSDSQDPQIKNLSVVYYGSSASKHATVQASFQAYDEKVNIDYEMLLYDDAPQRRWGVSDIRIRDAHGTNELLQTLHKVLNGECKGY